MVHMGLLHCKVRYICQKKFPQSPISNPLAPGLQSCTTVLYVVSVVHVSTGECLAFLLAGAPPAPLLLEKGKRRADGQTPVCRGWELEVAARAGTDSDSDPGWPLCFGVG